MVKNIFKKQESMTFVKAMKQKTERNVLRKKANRKGSYYIKKKILVGVKIGYV